MKATEQAFKSADLLLQGSGGFGLLALDLAGVSERFVRKVPLSTWFRFRAVVEKPFGAARGDDAVSGCRHLFRSYRELVRSANSLVTSKYGRPGACAAGFQADNRNDRYN
jgi:hypothetical protein